MLAQNPIIDGSLADEKLRELLAIGCELPQLDFKANIDLGATKGRVELAKDVGAMQVLGGYILGGVNPDGSLNESMAVRDLRAFDEANLVPVLLKWLPSPLALRTRVASCRGIRIAMLYVSPHPDGCAFFRADGKYAFDGSETTVFRAGDVYWRDGTRSVRLSQDGLQRIIERRVADALTVAVAGSSTEPPALHNRLEVLLRTGARIRGSARISLDGSCAAAEVWEHDVISALEESDRSDLVVRLLAPATGDTFRGVISGPWRTRVRMDRLLATVSNFVGELQRGERAASP